MALSYLYQLVNILAGLIMLPLLLGLLSAQDFLQWSLFIVIAGLTLQIESAIQTVLVRNIAGESSRSYSGFHLAITNSRGVYIRFSFVVFVAMGFGGAAYLGSVYGFAQNSSWIPQWSIFVLAYCFNYMCGPNNCILIATDHTTKFNLINSASRLINLSLTFFFLIKGMGIYGLVFSFLASVLVGCSLNYIEARKVHRNYKVSALRDPNKNDFERPELSNIVKFGTFVVLSYALYRSVLLITVMRADAVEQNAGLALTLQIFAIFSTVSMTPFQMRVAPLVRALMRKDSHAASVEFSKLNVMLNVVFVVCVVLILILPDAALQSLNPDIQMIDKFYFLLMAVGFLVEANLQSIASTMLIQKNMKFIKIYLTSVSLVAIVSATIIFGSNSGPMSLFIAIIAIQTFITLPAFVVQLRSEIPVSRHSYYIAASHAKSFIYRLFAN